MIKKEWQLSYSAIAAFKACPMRFYHKYILGLVPIEETESQRMGTNWHKILEIGDQDAVMEHLNEAYATVPMNKTKEQWETERIVLLYSFVGYNWYYQDVKINSIAEELKFELPLRSPTSGRALPHVVVRGKIDNIFSSALGYWMRERKSTSKSLDPDSTYWNHLNLDTQTRLYPWAAAQLDPEYRDIKILYDVWHKPTIRPKKLTQGDSKKFVETGEYMGEKFDLSGSNWIHTGKGIEIREHAGGIQVNSVQAEVEPGAKEGTFAIRETPEMFGARLLKDITERPEFYFVQKEIPRTADDLEQFEQEMLNIYRTMKIMNKNDRWWCCESQCEATFRCPYTEICYNNIQVNPECPPEGFKNIFKKKETDNG